MLAKEMDNLEHCRVTGPSIAHVRRSLEIYSHIGSVGEDLRSSKANTQPFQSFISLSTSRFALGAQMALM